MSSLAVALLRESKIPARYKKSLIEIETGGLRNLMGVEDNKAIVHAFVGSGIPLYLHPDSNLSGNTALIDADLSNEKYFIIEWTWAELFYDYDERGANVDSTLQSFASDAELEEFANANREKQWIPIDVVFQNYEHDKKQVLHDTANFDTENFFYQYLQSLEGKSALESYKDAILQSTGMNIMNYQSSVVPDGIEFDVLPITLPFNVVVSPAEPVVFSEVPDSQKQKVKISLISGGVAVLEHTYLAKDLDNVPLNLSYEGFSAGDAEIIAAYGGIHATPSELVDIRAFFMDDSSKFDGAAALQIGETLTLQFELIVDGVVAYSDQKFSTAGNNEGIFISLSQIQKDPWLDDEADPDFGSLVMLEGNAMMAREYLRKIDEESRVIEKALDYQSNVLFSRAVVTQNRILNEFDGTATSFDFRGLSLDSSKYISDYSRRGVYDTHAKDYRLIAGLNNSYQEGLLFPRLSSLDSISTVRGLQLAYNDPAYTVHVVSSENEAVIDSLDLSANTKANMHSDVQDGRTIITPNTFVQEKNWKGLFYISLAEDGGANYAIGEQSQVNGSFSVDGVEYDDFFVLFKGNTIGAQSASTVVPNYFELGVFQVFSYQDMPEKVGGLYCSLEEEQYNAMKADAGWHDAYGKPCFIGTKTFGNVIHQYKLASNGAKFVGNILPGAENAYVEPYDYWVVTDAVRTKVKESTNNFQEAKFGFSAIAGTYYHDSYSTEVYYQPKAPKKISNIWQDQANSWAVSGGIKNKLKDKHYKGGVVLKWMGYPVHQQASASPSTYGDTGDYQTFAGGQIYEVDDYVFDDTYYVPYGISKTHNSSDYAIGVKKGTGGKLGFPQNDPIKGVDGYTYQEFENSQEIKWKFGQEGTVIPFRKYRCEIYGDVTNDLKLKLYFAHGVTDSAISIAEGIGEIPGLLYDVAKYMGHGLFNLDEVKDQIDGLIESLSALDMDDLLALLDGASNAAIDEWKAAYGENGCSARARYIEGRLAGEIAAVVVPVAGANSLLKVKALVKVKKAEQLVKLKKLTAANLKTFAGFVTKGKYKGNMLMKVDDFFKEQFPWYKDALNSKSPFALDEAIAAGYLDGDLKYGFYSLDNAIEKMDVLSAADNFDEIMFVMKKNGDIVFAPRDNFHDPFPHAILSEGDDVLSAGIAKFENGKIIINNHSGHFKPHGDTLDLVKNRINEDYSNIDIIVNKNIGIICSSRKVFKFGRTGNTIILFVMNDLSKKYIWG
ncbi:hypothetical protein JKY72_05015 [Candidatus Gracilibacteria bacterium]|nr:hypothetical protein [Candidatus Gracilibacteria bacterium]